MKRIEIIKRKDKQGSNVQGRGDKKGLIEL